MPDLIRPSQKHHYIPRFLLKRWVGADGRLERYTRPFRKVDRRRVFPSEVGYVTDLYRSAGEAERNRYWLENRLFQTVDNYAAIALEKLNRWGSKALLMRT
ncbi:DUF4238 domain-containing protein [Stakelama tenebrarum]|uniref:DUF4238 domain-containing protein n=1 Tax=Stakelama tenebrarum TaxID=2711215 RepID=A0A6G6Y8R7_9SPHN|nr:DUF4238 domain-containing protein [Sphingosinithalassobacter tenebrarum]